MARYSFSILKRGNDRVIEICSYYIHHEQFPSYVVELLLFKKGRYRLKRQKSFSTIDRAEAHHMETVLKLNDEKGYTIESSSVK